MEVGEGEDVPFAAHHSATSEGGGEKGIATASAAGGTNGTGANQGGECSVVTPVDYNAKCE